MFFRGADKQGLGDGTHRPWLLFIPVDKSQFDLTSVEMLYNSVNPEICSDDCVILVVFPQSSYPIWEDFITKAGKLQSQLRWVRDPVHVPNLGIFFLFFSRLFAFFLLLCNHNLHLCVNSYI